MALPGAIMSLRMVGPLLGVIINSYFLTLNEHPFSESAGTDDRVYRQIDIVVDRSTNNVASRVDPPTGMSIRDPRWIGAWWLPFAGWGVLMTLVSIPLLLFPKNIRRATRQETRPAGLSKATTKPIPKSLWDKIVTDVKVIDVSMNRISMS